MNETFDGRRFFSYMFIAAIAVLFALQWGPGSVGCGRAGSRGDGSLDVEHQAAATVNGKEVPLKDFAARYYDQLNRFKTQGLTPQLAKQLGFHTQLLDQMIDLKVLEQAAEKRGIVASDDELLDVLKQNPNFQREGKFDLQTYKDVVMQINRRTPEDFEDDVRRQLSAQKLLELVAQGAVVSDDEVRARYEKEANKASVTFVKFATAHFAEKVTAPKPAELDAWIAKHGAEISDHYEKNKGSYFQDARAHVRQILLRASKEDGDAKRAEVKAKAEALLKEIQGGKDFAEAAKTSSDDTETKAKGGDMGFVERFSLPGPVADAVFQAKAGDVTNVVESPIGYHIVKVEEMKAPETKPLDAVKREIAETLYKKSKAVEMAKAEAQKALAAAAKGKKLSELYPKSAEAAPAGQFETQTKPEATESGSFSSSSVAIPQLGMSEELKKAVFALEAPQLLNQTWEVNGDIFVVAVTERSKPSDADYATQKEQMMTEAMKAKQTEMRESFVKSLRKQAQVVTNQPAIEKVTEG